MSKRPDRPRPARLRRSADLLLLVLVLGGCGGGGGGTSVTNSAPVADAGPDQVATIGVMVSLDGGSSLDPDADPLTYRWQLQTPPQSDATLSGSGSPTAEFVPDVAGTYTATLIVDDGRRESSDSVSVVVPLPGVTMSGRITFDRVPHDPVTGGLDYLATSRSPVRGAVLEALDTGGATLATTVTDDDGRYSVVVPSATGVVLRVRAQMLRNGGPGWDIRVVDNTQSEAIYTLASTAVDTGAEDSTLDLHAPSGWSIAQSRYTDVRAAAPFAILDTVYDSLAAVLSTDPGLVLPALTLNWSPANRSSTRFDPDGGEILTTAYFLDPGYADAYREIFILGDADVDTDEYDGHVLAHEWAHYLEDRLSRTDSPGGAHSIVSTLDPRLAFSEGWANAFSAIAMATPLYVDSLGTGQATSFTFDIESNTTANRGWFSEASVHSVLYDIYDAEADGADSTALGLAPILTGLRSWHRDTDALTSIFSLITDLKTAYPADAPNIDALLAGQSIHGPEMDAFGSTETNDAGSNDVLPVYTRLVADGNAMEVCSIVTFGQYNGLSVRRFLVFDPPFPGTYRISATGPSGSNPDMALYAGGARELFEGGGATESVQRTLNAGRQVLEVYEYSNVAISAPARGRTCFQVSVEQI